MLSRCSHTGLPFNGALVAGSSAVAWLARDSSKPGRVAPGQGGCGEAWVVHATPDWSNSRAAQPRQQVRLNSSRGGWSSGVDPAMSPVLVAALWFGGRGRAGVEVHIYLVFQALHTVVGQLIPR
jgi:predicted NAD/FAD-dependent oxidoreductase